MTDDEFMRAVANLSMAGLDRFIDLISGVRLAQALGAAEVHHVLPLESSEKHSEALPQRSNGHPKKYRTT